ncbi:transmembrane protein 26-like [Hyla sarda]|uniref:transmembrane protein 26-like n=1 Tax=Hyla sarda TaxID=327740 RepID=UPI0024C21F0B|nr:transmembrane protein 26-like [Hyla sarda]
MKCKCVRILAAIFSRLLFSLHEVIMVALAVEDTKDYTYWFLLLGVLLLFIEMIVTLKMTKHGEWKWFSPMVFIYLCTIIPTIFVIELDNLQVLMNVTNLTVPECTKTVYKENSEMVQGSEELTILVLIIGRWLMPRGKMSRDQLAQLLLMYLALGADILDILQLIKEPSVKSNKTVTVVGLCLFTWAVLQFTIVLTQTWSSPPDTEVDRKFQSSAKVKNYILSVCCSSEVWSVIITVGMQDGPFLIYRLYLVTREGVFSDSMTFFICKNILSVIIQIYRVVVFFCKEHRKRKKFNQSDINL